MEDEESNGSNIWELYDLKGNPFSTNPILISGGEIPITSFVGRGRELKRLENQIMSGNGSRTIVAGNTGVGKTSFVNYALYLFNNKYFIIEVPDIGKGSSTDLLYNTLFHIWVAINNEKHTDWLEENTLKQLESISKLDRHVLTGGDLPFIGGGLEENITNPPYISFTILKNLFELIIEQIYKNQDKEIIIVYDNFDKDNLPKKSIREIFNNMRDLFQTSHVHFIFIGDFNFEAIIRGIPRVSSIIPEVIELGKLSVDEIKKILELRLDKFKKSENIKKLYEDEVISMVYNLYDGNIRDILNTLSKAIVLNTHGAPDILTSDNVRKIFREEAEKIYYSDRFSVRARKILDVIIKERKEISVKKIVEETGYKRGTVSTTLTNELVGCVYLAKNDGKDKFYALAPEMKWLLL